MITNSLLRKIYILDLTKTTDIIINWINEINKKREDLTNLIKKKYPKEEINYGLFKNRVDFYNILCKNIDSSEYLYSTSIEINNMAINEMQNILKKIIYKFDDSNWYDYFEFIDYYGETLGKKKWNEIEFVIDFSKFTYDTLPFISTRSITNMEQEIFILLVEYFNVYEHFKILKKQLTNLDNLHKSNKVSIDNYNRKKIIKKIKYLLSDCKSSINLESKIINAHKFFDYICSKECKLFLEKELYFKEVVLDKLKELYYLNNIRIAKKWYRLISNKRIPLNN